MWEELASYKNHFLQLEVKHLKRESINDFVTKEYDKVQSKRCSCKCPNEDNCSSSTYFRDHAALAYGFQCIEKLTHDICSDDPLLRWQSVNSLTEVILNPWQAQRAIMQFDLVRKCKNMFFRIQNGYLKEFYNEHRQLMKIFYLVSSYLNGAHAIVGRLHLVEEFYSIIYNHGSTRYLACKILRNLTEKTEILLFLLNETSSFQNLSTIFNADPCTPFYPNALWEHLCHFLEIAPKLAIKSGFFELFYERIKNKTLFYHELCMKCFAMLLRCEEGQQCFDKIDGVKLLYDIIADERTKLDSYEYVMLALQHGLVSNRSLWRCREFTDLPNRIIDLAKLDNRNLQLECFKCLRLLSAMPCLKAYILHGCMSDLMSIECLNEPNECTRDLLAEWLNRDICDSSEM
ncbi:uncharacterized protein LOC126754558 [Bactrocera neohumeralis]|uniref:uncharacterized protein LOC126754558 n=1 Tax=Bactrocera neohumeralis TaxID=98809 RepID=UPI002166263A|nr:uncharacterized protein LOC126754558 [Bactrocera neohumeralis]